MKYYVKVFDAYGRHYLTLGPIPKSSIHKELKIWVKGFAFGWALITPTLNGPVCGVTVLGGQGFTTRIAHNEPMVR